MEPTSTVDATRNHRSPTGRLNTTGSRSPGSFARVEASTWQRLASEHVARAERWTTPRLARRKLGQTNPVEDFLFEYYPFSPAKLRTWHPGYGVVLEGVDAEEYLRFDAYIRVPDGVTADVLALRSKRERLDLAVGILAGTRSRQPHRGCFALHEWAMTYGLEQQEVRHPALPLRVSPSTIAATIETIGLRCTHIDAYRFFTPDATPLNALVPTRATQPDLEQPGCLHASMDLYKVASWFSPLVSSELVLRCFENAAFARMLDMRASPYDVTAYGLDPIRIETLQGRREYAEEQDLVIQRSEPIRAELLMVLEELREELVAVEAAVSPDRARSTGTH